MKTTVEIQRQAMPSILKAGGLVVEKHAVLPMDDRMLLFPSICGRLLMTGEGYCCDTDEAASAVLNQHGKPHHFSWDLRVEKYHEVDLSGMATDLDVKICRKAGFTLYRDLIYARFYAVLSQGKGRDQMFYAGKIYGGHLQLIGEESCMVPEQAVGKIYMHLHYDYQPKYHLRDLAAYA